MVEVKYLNNDGAGFAGKKNVADGTSLGRFFSEQTDGGAPENYTIRVNSEPCEETYELQEGDRVTVTPKNISGA